MKKFIYLIIGATLTICFSCKKDLQNSNGGNQNQAPFAPVLTYNYEGNNQKYVGQAIFDSLFNASDVILSFSGLAPDSVIHFYWGNKAFTTKPADHSGNISLLKGDFSQANINEADSLWLKQGSHSSSKLVIFKRFQIRSWQDLQAMRVTLTGSYSLINDITFPDVGTGGFPKTGFTPVGIYIIAPFTGSFTGNGHFINHFNCKKTSYDTSHLTNGPPHYLGYTGMFGIVDIGNVKKISGFTINQRNTDSVVSSPSIVNSAGTVISILISGTIDSVNVNGGVVYAKLGTVGGLISEIDGTLSLSTIIKHCSTSCKVIMNYDSKSGSIGLTSGGLLGYIKGGTPIITDCFTTGDVSGPQYTGGLIGAIVGYNNQSNPLNNCYSTGNITNTSHYQNANGLGGLIGIIGTNNTFYITNCHTSGDVNNTTQVTGYAAGTGGLIGICAWANLSACFTTGNIASSFTGTGGLIGSHSDSRSDYKSDSVTISNCYAKGNINGVDYVGGLIGDNYASITNSYSSGTITGRDYIGGLSGFYCTATNCYSSSQIIANGNYVGGISGFGLTANNCFYSGTSITATGPYVTYLGWNFDAYKNFYVNSSAVINDINIYKGRAINSNLPKVIIANFTKDPGNTSPTTDPFQGFQFGTIWQFNSGAWPTLKNMPQ
jgi:hypothetical protein